MHLSTTSILSIFTNTHPYLDPGTGSFIIQIIIAAVLGVGFFVKVYWKKIKAFVTRQPYTNDVVDDNEENQQ